jgi:hypothetical protein
MARRIIAALLIIVASLLAPFAVGSIWAERTLTETQSFNETLAPLADDPLVQQTVATEVTEAIVDVVDAEARAEQLLGNLSGPLADLRSEGALDSVIAGAIASGVNNAIASGVDSYVQSDQFGQGWEALTSVLHEQFVKLLERDTTDAALTLQDGQIVLSTGKALETIQTQLSERGVSIVDQLDVPGREIVLADAPNLQLVSDALAIFIPVATWLWVVVLLMFLGGVLLWRPKSRGVLWTGLGLTLGGALLFTGVNLGEAQIVDAAPAGYSALVESVSTVLLRFLVNGVLVMISLGLVLMLAGWLGGGTKSGRRVRDWFAGVAHRWGSPLADGPIGRFTSDHPMLVPTLRGIVLALALGYLLLADRLSPSIIFWTAVVTAAALLVVEIIEGAGRGYEQPHAGALVAQAEHDPVASGASAPGTSGQDGATQD